jgi:hypothetical protein
MFRSFVSNNGRLTEKQLRAIARDKAYDELPATNSTHPDDTELRSLREAMSDAQNARFMRGATIADVAEAFDRVERSLPNDIKLKAQIEPHAASFRQQLASTDGTLYRAIGEEVGKEWESDSFRRRNGLIRQPHYPENRTLSFLAPVLLGFAFEAAVNVGLFGERLSSGAFGAFAISGGVALANGTLAVGAAELTRNLHHRASGRRLLGLAGLLLLIILIIFLHLAYAHYRTLLQTKAPDSVAVLNHVASAPMAISFPGLVLLALGLGTAFALWHRAFHSDDPYPGYGALDRSLRAARQRADVARAGLSDLRRELLNRAREDLAKILADYEAGVSRMRSNLGKLAGVDEIFALQVQAVSERLAEDHQIYFEENIRYRHTPPPARAYTPPTIQIPIEPVQLEPYQRRLDAAVAAQRALHEKAHQLLLGFDAFMETSTAQHLRTLESRARSPRHLDVPEPAPDLNPVLP